MGLESKENGRERVTEGGVEVEMVRTESVRESEQ